MIIGIDGNEANVKLRVGVHQYAFEILWGLYRLNNKRKSDNTFKIYLKSSPRDDLPKENNKWKYKILSGGGMWILMRLTPYLLKKGEVDIFFSPSHYLPLVPRLPKVMVVHDLRYLDFSGQFKKYDYWQLKYWTAISISISKYIISVSKSTNKDIVRHYSSASDKTKIVYHGYNRKRFKPDIDINLVRRAKEKYKIRDDYLLFISTLKPSKNIERLLEAFTTVLKKRKNYESGDDINVRLVIAGKKGWLFETIFQRSRELNLGKSVIFTDFVDEVDKAPLIRGAKLLVSPSLTEGFGMQVLESMACGTPVLLSKVDSLPEVAGDAGVYVDPYNPNSIAVGIEKVLKMDRTKYNRLVRKSLEQAKNFSWEKSARETLRVIESASVKHDKRQTR